MFQKQAEKKDMLSDAERATARALTAKAHEMKLAHESASGDASDQ